MARTRSTALVVAAQHGDPEALDELVREHLALVYTLARRALPDDPDVDDVVQEVMHRAVSELPSLRRPDSFRLWLVSITARQVSTLQRRRATNAGRPLPLEHPDAAGAEAPGHEDLTGLQVELSRQRRQTALAAGWLDPDDRTLLSLWWLEVAGELTRGELAGALGLTTAHAGVRIQRMRTQLDLSRSLVAALDAPDRCPELTQALDGWDGAPAPRWRKRLARHVRECETCGGRGVGLVPAEQLMAGYVWLAVPLGLASALAMKAAVCVATVPVAAALGAGAAAGTGGVAGAVGAKLGVAADAIRRLVAHPWGTSAAAAVLASSAVTAAVWTRPTAPSDAAPPQPRARPAAEAPVRAPSAAPSPVVPDSTEPVTPTRVTSTAPRRPSRPARLVPLGTVAFESVDWKGWWLGTPTAWAGMSASAEAGGPKPESVYVVVPGLADPACISLRTREGEYLRHLGWPVWRSELDRTPLFRADATFCPLPGSAKGSVRLESKNFPGYLIRHRSNGTAWIDAPDGSSGFDDDSSFRPRRVDR